MMKKLILWMLVISCMGTIFFFSSQEATESKKVSSGLIKTVVKIIDFNDSLSAEEIDEISENLTFVVRKGAHFSAYALLCILITLLLTEYKILKLKRFLMAVGTSFLYACSDEIHQLFVPGRAFQLTDLAVDTAGIILGAAIFFVFYTIINNIKNKQTL